MVESRGQGGSRAEGSAATGYSIKLSRNVVSGRFVGSRERGGGEGGPHGLHAAVVRLIVETTFDMFCGEMEGSRKASAFAHGRSSRLRVSGVDTRFGCGRRARPRRKTRPDGDANAARLDVEGTSATRVRLDDRRLSRPEAPRDAAARSRHRQAGRHAGKRVAKLAAAGARPSASTVAGPRATAPSGLVRNFERA